VVKVDFLFYFYPKTKGEDAIYATCIFWHHHKSYAFPGVQVDILYILSLPCNVLKGDLALLVTLFFPGKTK